MRVAVVGIGNDLRGDDSAGPRAVRMWQQEHAQTALRSGVEVHLIDTPGTELLSVLQASDAALLVDAVRSGKKPGTVHRLDRAAIPKFAKAPGSVHGWGIPQILRLAESLDPDAALRTTRLVGIEGSESRFGTQISAEVRAALPIAAAAIQQELLELLGS